MVDLSAGIVADDTLMVNQGGGFRLTNPNREDKSIYRVFDLSITLLKGTKKRDEDQLVSRAHEKGASTD